jgi:uncharacterized membrane protein
MNTVSTIYNLMLPAGMLLAYGGLCAISRAMDRHHAQLHGRGALPSPGQRWRLRLLGWTSIAAAFAACIAANGWHIGPVLWCGQLSASAWLLALLLHYAPRQAVRLAILGQGAALVCAALWLGAR